ncbi:MAG TPA: hypothetical protein PKL64_07280, partial [Bacteroidales bacterium]|nr:hypothetical protein [Bacteroidales bacterium]
MKKIIFLLILFILTTSSEIFSQTRATSFNQPPEWSKNVIWYQIFVERFYNGDPTNDPKPENM